MEPLSIVLGIAGTVVSNLLTELITGKSKAARQAEVERAVAIALADQQRQLGEHAAAIRQQTLDEVALLIDRSPDLQYRGDDVILTRPLRGRAIRGEGYVNAELRKRLENMQEVIFSRRKQLGLPITTEDAVHMPEEWVPVADSQPTPKSQLAHRSTNTGSEWVETDQTSDRQPTGPWSAELLRMQDRIRRRRAGLEVTDDE